METNFRNALQQRGANKKLYEIINAQSFSIVGSCTAIVDVAIIQRILEQLKK